jgi:non-ribosomal peptide synthetase component F
VLEDHKQYWLGQLGGELPVLELAGDRWRPVMKTYNGGMVSGLIEERMADGLRKLCREARATMFMGLLAVVNGLLYRYTGQMDIIVGSPVAGREHVDLEGQVGFYVNMLALRTRLNGRGSYRELLSTVREMTMEAYAHQQYPLDELVRVLGVQRDPGRSAVFDVVVVLQNAGGSISEVSLADVRISDEGGHDGRTSKYDLTFSFEEGARGLAYSVEYNSDIYDRSTIIRLGEHLEHLLQSILLSPDAAISSLNYLSEKEKKMLRVI